MLLRILGGDCTLMPLDDDEGQMKENEMTMMMMMEVERSVLMR